MGFADKLKQVTYELFGHLGLRPGIYYEAPERYKERENKTIMLNGELRSPRDIWIEFGNHCRKYNPNIWLDCVLKNTKCDVLIMKDTRFMNEVQGVLVENGITVKVSNPNVPETEDEADSALANYTGWHHHVVNNRSLDDLRKTTIRFATDFVLPLLQKPGV